MKSNQHDRILNPTYIGIGLVLVFFIWWLYSFILVKQGNSALLFPDPWMVLNRFCYNFTQASVWLAVGYTLMRLFVGFAVSFLIAALLGILSALFKPIRFILKPFVLICKTVPTAAVVFIILIMVGTNWTPCYLVFLVVFPIVYESFLSGIDGAGEDVRDALRLDMSLANPRAVFGVLVPMASPYILLSIVTSLGLGMKVSIMAEIVAGGSSAAGLGRLIYIANSIDGDTTQVMALSLAAILIIAVIDLLIYLVKRKLKAKGLINA
jgi:NitT/TauT family transport system permease protein